MANPKVFDELSSRITKTVPKRPDSGIHNSMELSGDHEKSKRNAGEEQTDSGRESDQQEVVQKKKGFLKNFKKMFKTKKKTKMGKRSKSEHNLGNQFKAQSEPDMLASSSQPKRMYRYNSEMSKQNEIVDTNRNVEVVEETSINDDDEGKERKRSLKDAQQYIRSSLRKFKNKRKKSSESDSPNSTIISPDRIGGSSGRYKQKELTVDDTESFFNKSVSAAGASIDMTHASIDLSDISSYTPNIETSAAKDRIRIAPRDRRKPARFRSPPSSSTRSPPLQKLHENGHFRTQSEISLDKSSSDEQPFVKGESWKENQIKKAPPKPARRSLAAKSTENLSSPYNTPLDIGSQRSRSANSRENISIISERPAVKPRSAASSNTSLNKNTDIRSHSRESFGILNNSPKETFYQEESSTRSVKSNKSNDKKQESAKNEIDLLLQNRGKSSVDDTERKKVSRSSSDERSSGSIFKRSSGDLSTSKSREDISWIKRKEEEKSEKPVSPVYTHVNEETTNREKTNYFKKDNKDLFDFSLRDRSKSDAEKIPSGGSGVERTQSLQKTSSVDKSYGLGTNKTNKDFTWIRNEEDNKVQTEAESKLKRSAGDIFKKSELENKSSDFPRKLNTNSNPSFFKSTGDLTENRNSLRKHTEERFRKSTEDLYRLNKNTYSKNSAYDKSINYSSKHKDSYGETTFALTSPRQELELPPDFTSKENRAGTEKDLISNSERSSYRYEFDKLKNDFNIEESSMPRRSRPQSVKICSSEIAEVNSAVLLSTSTSNENIKDLGKILQPEIKPKPPTSPKKPKKDIKPLASPKNETSGGENALSFSRKSLNKVPKNKDFLCESNSDDKNFSFQDIPTPNAEEPKWKTSFGSADIERKQKLDKVGTGNNDDHKTEFGGFSLKKMEMSDSERQQNKPSEPTEYTSVPVFNRVSLKKVPKREDFIVKEDVNVNEEPAKDRKDVTSPALVEKFKNDHNIAKHRTGSLKAPPAKPINISKPQMGTAAFSFQSQDINERNRSKSLSAAEAKKMRRGISPTSDEEENKVPDWINMAKMKQRNIEDEDTTTTVAEKEEDTRTKPSIIKPKPKPSPRPDAPRKLPTQPNTSKNLKLPDTPQMATPSRTVSHSFAAKTGISKCIVCDKTAYAMERCEVDNHILHKACAKCAVCSRKLNVGGIFIHEMKVYCSQHK